LLVCLIDGVSTIFQLYRALWYPGGQFYWWMKPDDPQETTDMSQVTDKLYQIMLYTSPWSRFDFTTSVVIGTDCIGSCKLPFNHGHDGPWTNGISRCATEKTTTPNNPLLIKHWYKLYFIWMERCFHQSHLRPLY